MATMEVDVAPSEEHPVFFAVQLRLDADEPQELSPLEEAVANHIADVLRLKLAMDAGTPPLSQVALSRGLEELSDMLEDLRAETVQSVMETMAAAAAGDDGSEGSEGGAEVDQRPVAGPAAAGVAAGSGAVGSGDGAATDGDSMAAPQRQARPRPAGAAGVRQEASDQTDVPLQLSAEHAQVEQAGPPPQPAQGLQQRQAAAQAEPERPPDRQQPPEQEPAAAAQQRRQPGRRKGGADSSARADARLARKLQLKLIAEERRAGRQRRGAAPAEGTLKEQQLRKRRKEVGPGSSPASPEQADEHASPVVDTAAAGSPVAATAAAFEGLGSPGQGPVPEEVDEAWAEYRGVVALHRGAELRWQAVFSAALDMEGRPSMDGPKQHCRDVCKCGSQGEAAVARDLALLWREVRLGFLKGDLTWQEEEYNFEGESYHQHPDVTAPLAKCRMLPELKVLLASLAAEGVLARLAGSLPRNPLSLVVRRPPVQLCTQATLAAAQRRYRHVQANGGTVRLPWRAAIQLPPQLRTNSPRSVFVAPSGSFGTPAQAAVAADLAVVWREKMLGGQGDVEGQQYNFPLQGYLEDELLWGKLMVADEYSDLRVLLRKMRDCGRLEATAQRQLAAAAAAGSAGAGGSPGPPGGNKRGRSRPPSAAAWVSGGSGAAGGSPGNKRWKPGPAANPTAAAASSGSPGKMRAKPEPAATHATPTATAAAAAVCGAAAAAAAPQEAGGDVLDPLPLFAELTAASDEAAAQRSGVSLELCGRYLVALQSKPPAMQRWEVGCLRMWVAQRRWDGVAGTMRAAVRAAGLE